MDSSRYRNHKVKYGSSRVQPLRSRHDRPKPFYKRGVFIVGILILLVFSIAFLFYGDGLWFTWQHQKRLQELAQRNDSLRQHNQDMADKIKKLESGDKLTLEKEARINGLALDGEEVTILEPMSDQESQRKVKDDE